MLASSASSACSHQGAQRADDYIYGILNIERCKKADFMPYIEGTFVERALGLLVEVPLFAKELREEWMIEDDLRARI